MPRSSRARVLRTPPTPAYIDPRIVVVVATAAWVVSAIALALGWSWLTSHGHREWLWTALAGAALGLAGLMLMGRHRDQGRV